MQMRLPQILYARALKRVRGMVTAFLPEMGHTLFSRSDIRSVDHCVSFLDGTFVLKLVRPHLQIGQQHVTCEGKAAVFVES